MAGKGRVKIRLQSTESAFSYTTTKNPRPAQPTKTGKLQKRKFDPILRKHVLFKEEKIKS